MATAGAPAESFDGIPVRYVVIPDSSESDEPS
jgi:hypothetical protein